VLTNSWKWKSEIIYLQIVFETFESKTKVFQTLASYRKKLNISASGIDFQKCPDGNHEPTSSKSRSVICLKILEIISCLFRRSFWFSTIYLLCVQIFDSNFVLVNNLPFIYSLLSIFLTSVVQPSWHMWPIKYGVCLYFQNFSFICNLEHTLSW